MTIPGSVDNGDAVGRVGGGQVRAEHPNVVYIDLIEEARELLRLQASTEPGTARAYRRHHIYVDGRKYYVLTIIEQASQEATE